MPTRRLAAHPGHRRSDARLTALAAAMGLAIAPVPSRADETAAVAAPAPAATTTVALATQRVEVVGDADDDYRETAATVGRGVQALRDLPQGVTIVNRAVMDAQGAASLTDALRSVPGITLGGAEGGQIGNNINLRGFTARTDILLDGTRDRGQYYRDVFFLDSVEVLKGPSSLLVGRGSTGGVIQQVSKLPRLEPVSEATLAADSQGSLRTTVDLGRTLSDGAAFRIAAMAQDARSTRDTLHDRDTGIAPSVRLGIGTPTQLTVSALVQHNEDMPDYGLPPLDGAPAPVSFDNDYGMTDDRTVQNVASFAAMLEHRPAEGLTFRNQSRAMRTTTAAREVGASRVGTWDGTRFTALPTATTGNATDLPLDQLHVLLGSHDRTIEDHGLYNQTDVTGEWRTGAVRHALQASLDLAHDDYANQASTRANPAIAGATGVAVVRLIDPVVADTPAGVVETAGNLARARANSVGVSLNDTMTLTPHWKLVAGLRRDRFAATLTNSINSANTTGSTAPARASQVVGFTSVRTGLMWQPTAAQTWYASYGTSFDPSMETLTVTSGTQALGPERNRSFEFGAKLDLRPGELTLDAAVFRIEKQNARSQVEPGVYALEGHVRVDGLETSLTGRLARDWQVVAGYTLMDGQVLQASAIDGTAGRTLANTPRHSATLWSTWTVTREWELGGGAVAMSRRWASSTNVVSAPGFVRLDATVAWHQPRYDLRLNVFNVGDARYVAALQSSDGGRSVPGAGRTAQVTGTWRF